MGKLFSCSVVLILFIVVLSQGIPSIYGRPLINNNNRPHNNSNNNNNAIIANNNNATPAAPPSEDGQAVIIGESQPPPPPAGHTASNFRPTAPGHSPGVGHAIKN
ncbi:hypothetical protein CsatA_014019 [Cannabis sativa]